MFCTVIFGENDNQHTRRYLYRYEAETDIEPGRTVIVPAKDKEKFALVHTVYKSIPCEIAVNEDQVKYILSVNNMDMGVSSEQARSFILALIDDYKDGVIPKEVFNGLTESFVRNNSIKCAADMDLQKVLYDSIPSAKNVCIVEIDDKELAFWKIIKDAEYFLRYGHSYQTAKNPTFYFEISPIDPIEYADEYLRVELEMERLIRDQIGEEGRAGFCHLYWNTKKKILKERYGIEWKSPAELIPEARFD